MGVLQMQIGSLEIMYKQQEEATMLRKQFLERQKHEMSRLESETALISLKISEASSKNTQLYKGILALKKLNAIEASKHPKKTLSDQISEPISDVIALLATRNILALKEQLLACVKNLRMEQNLNLSYDNYLKDLERDLQDSSNLKFQYSLDGETHNFIEEQGKFLGSSGVNFEIAQTLLWDRNRPEPQAFTQSAKSAKERILELPLHLILRLLTHYAVKLKQSSAKKHSEFIDLHKRWTHGHAALKEFEEQLHGLTETNSCTIESHSVPQTILWNKNSGKIIKRLEEFLEILFQVRTFVTNFAMRIHSIISRTNKICENIGYKYHFHLFCPFYFTDELQFINEEDSESTEKTDLSISKRMIKINGNENGVITPEAWMWLKSRLPLLRIYQVENRSKTVPNSNCRFFYDLAIVDMKEFSNYLSVIINEFTLEKKKSILNQAPREWPAGHSISQRSLKTLVRRENGTRKETHTIFTDICLEKSFKEKVLIENKFDYKEAQ
jgi:hypothetical protein